MKTAGRFKYYSIECKIENRNIVNKNEPWPLQLEGTKQYYIRCAEAVLFCFASVFLLLCELTQSAIFDSTKWRAVLIHDVKGKPCIFAAFVWIIIFYF